MQHLPKHKSTPSGWKSFNCVACHHLGHKPDRRGRGGIHFTPDGGFTYHCFNCKFKTGWGPGMPFGHKCVQLSEYLHINQEIINEFQLEALKLINQGVQPLLIKPSPTIIQALERFESANRLPQGSKPIYQLLQDNCSNTSFLMVAQALVARSPDIFERYPHVYWSPQYPKRAIFANIWDGHVIGWTARNFDKMDTKAVKYLSDQGTKKLFNWASSQLPERRYVVLVEGIFDAIAINSVALMGSDITSDHKQLIDFMIRDEKNVIILPDRDASGRALANQALDMGLQLSLPDWPLHIKDADEAVREFGQIMTVKTILDSTLVDPIQARIKCKNWFSHCNLKKTGSFNEK